MCICLCFFRAAPTAYGESQAGDQIRAVAAGLRQIFNMQDSGTCACAAHGI